MKNEIDRILGKPSKQRRNVFDIDTILPRQKQYQEVNLPQKPGLRDYSGKIPPIIIENHFHGQEQQPMMGKPRKFMSSMESLDENGMPTTMLDPNIPRPMSKQIKAKATNNILNDILGE
jgi:hypothetical protein